MQMLQSQIVFIEMELSQPTKKYKGNCQMKIGKWQNVAHCLKIYVPNGTPPFIKKKQMQAITVLLFNGKFICIL